MKLFVFLTLLTLVTCRSLLAQYQTDTSVTLLYETNRFDLTAKQKREIQKFLAVISNVTEVHGYTDTSGTMDFNRKLGHLRAQHTLSFIALSFETKVTALSSGEEFEQQAELSKNRKVIISGDLKPKPSPEATKTEEVLLDSFDVDNLTFVADRTILSPESLMAMPSFVSKIKRHKNVYFEVIGHVNYQSQRDQQYLKELYTLSQDRAKLICQILYENGIPKNRLRYVGVGNSQPLIKNPKNNNERMKNMRVQIIVSSEYRNHPDIKLEDFE